MHLQAVTAVNHILHHHHRDVLLLWSHSDLVQSEEPGNKAVVILLHVSIVTVRHSAKKPFFRRADGLDDEAKVLGEVEEAAALSFRELLEHQAPVYVGQVADDERLAVGAGTDAVALPQKSEQRWLQIDKCEVLHSTRRGWEFDLLDGLLPIVGIVVANGQLVSLVFLVQFHQCCSREGLPHRPHSTVSDGQIVVDLHGLQYPHINAVDGVSPQRLVDQAVLLVGCEEGRAEMH